MGPFAFASVVVYKHLAGNSSRGCRIHHWQQVLQGQESFQGIQALRSLFSTLHRVHTSRFRHFHTSLSSHTQRLVVEATKAFAQHRCHQRHSVFSTMSTANRCAQRLLDSHWSWGAPCCGIKHFGLVGVETKDDHRNLVRISGSEWRVKAALTKFSASTSPRSSPLHPSPVVSGGGAAQTVQHAPGASPYYPPQNHMEKNMMTLYPTMFDRRERPRTPRSPSYRPTLPSRYSSRYSPPLLTPPPNSLTKTSIEGESQSTCIKSVN